MAKETDKKEPIDSGFKMIAIRLNREEKTLLHMKMRKDGWQNISSYIKYSLFGLDTRRNYLKALKTADNEDKTQAMQDMFDELCRRLDYIGFRFDKEIFEIRKEIEKNVKASDLSKYEAMLNQMKKWEMNIFKDLVPVWKDCQTILKALGYDVKRNEFTYTESLPEYVLERAINDWNDVWSIEVKEAARRRAERFETAHGTTYDGVEVKKK